MRHMHASDAARDALTVSAFVAVYALSGCNLTAFQPAAAAENLRADTSACAEPCRALGLLVVTTPCEVRAAPSLQFWPA